MVVSPSPAVVDFTMIPQSVYRVARPASRAWNLCKSLCQLVLFWTFFLAVLPAAIWQLECLLRLEGTRFTSPLWRTVGIGLFTLASSLGFTSCLYMALLGRGTPLPTDTARELVIAGPYRYLRNPMAVAGLTQGFAVGVMMGSWFVIIYALFGALGWNSMARPSEEKDLEDRFGDSFKRYRDAVPCWIPRWTPYDPQNDSTSE